ncbi:MAG: D-alanyl-D-alanine carboxypeptidase [Hyphomicrobiales bacterium]|nr:D-alanyl-D-alanine carboxypeptidase [Hyphomicrobiales bacterium]MBV9427580.1 D-alanyl-D-alanine carboxypeptidase [Bradyrhizobiaceae bacterium]
MRRSVDRPARRIGRKVVAFSAVTLAVAIACDNADARSRHRRSHGSHVSHHGGYSPAYADIVVDANSGQVLHENSPDSLRHPASITKIMTLYLLFEQLEAGKLKLDSRLPVSSHAAAQSPTKLELKAGQTIAVEDAIKGMVTKSANDAAVVVAEALGGSEDNFGRLMTHKAHALGMTRTVYVNASGLPNNDQLTTARDQAILGRAIQERFPKYYHYFSLPSFQYHGVAMRNHNHLLGRVAGMDGIKTGYTHDSGFNLVTSVHRNGRHIVAVVLGGTSGGARDARMRELIETHIAQASTRHTAPMIAESATPMRAMQLATARPETPVEVPPAAPARVTVRPAASTRAATTPAANVTPPSGSSDPIRPLVVRTIQVRAAAVRTAGIGPLVVPQPNSAVVPPQLAAPAPQPVVPAPEPTVQHAPLPPPPGSRPGVLGVLPARGAPAEPPPPVVSKANFAERISGAAEAEPVAAAPAPPAPAPQFALASQPAAIVQPTPAASSAPPHHARGDWAIQIGAFANEAEAQARLRTARSVGAKVLGHADPFTEKVVKGSTELYRARFAGFDHDGAEAACHHFKRNDISCLALKN